MRLLLCVLLVACELPKPQPQPPSGHGDAVRIIAIDVGQGDSTLFIGPDGTVVLFDGGGLNHADDVRAVVDAEASGRVDHVVVSHYDADHLAGVADFLLGPDRQAHTADDGAPTAQLWDYGDDGNCTSQTCDRYRLSRAGRATVMQPGDVLQMGEAQLRCVAVNGKITGGAMVAPSDENSRSVSLLLEYGEFKGLFAGDLTGGGDGTANIEPAVAAVTGHLDLLHIDHHGSKTSSNQAALDLWSPRAGLLSVGTDNSYCHPAQAVLDRLASTGMHIFATGNGMTTADSRCSATVWPDGARHGLGTIDVRAYKDRTLWMVDEEVP